MLFLFVSMSFLKDDQSDFPLLFSHKSRIGESVQKNSSETPTKHEKFDPELSKLGNYRTANNKGQGSLKTGYSSTYFFNEETFKSLDRKKKDIQMPLKKQLKAKESPAPSPVTTHLNREGM